MHFFLLAEPSVLRRSGRSSWKENQEEIREGRNLAHMNTDRNPNNNIYIGVGYIYIFMYGPAHLHTTWDHRACINLPGQTEIMLGEAHQHIYVDYKIPLNRRFVVRGSSCLNSAAKQENRRCVRTQCLYVVNSANKTDYNSSRDGIALAYLQSVC